MESDSGLQTRSKLRKRPVSKEVLDIAVDIEEVIRSVPGASKYFRSGPAPKKPKKKPATTRQRPGPKPDKNQQKTVPASTAPIAGPSNTDTIDVEDSDDDIAGFHSLLPTHLENPLTFRFKKETGIASRKKAKTQPSRDTSLELEPIRDCAVYVYASKPAPPATSRTAKAAAPPVAERGPFFFPLNSTFQQFCTRLSAAVGCRSPALNLPFTRWKFMKPGNDNLKALGTEDGYKALIISLKERKKDLTIEVHMHPPLVLASDLPYKTDDFKPPDAFDELDAPAASSVQQQIATFDASAAPVMEELRERYPIGNHPSFPNKRIVTSAQFPDRCWEVTDIHIRVWAAHIMSLEGKATLDNPSNRPTSAKTNESASLTLSLARMILFPPL
ncbi:hypothetical protein DFH09DRAFT_1275256 [Mycena vulgaris]|nr:hypothetical protein DFH09DRAFT_1275256 [Mycena vulgaris]